MTQQVTTDDLRVQVADGHLFVRRWQPATLQDTTPLILLHDSLGSVELWRDFPAQLADHLQQPVFAYDRLGFGQSSARSQLPGWQFIAEEAETVFPDLLQALDIGDFALLGHSVGGAMALHVAATQGKACRWVVTEAAQAFVEERTREGIRQAKQFFAQPDQFKRLQRWHGEKAQWVLDAWIQTWLAPEFSDWSLDKVLSQVVSPVLVVHGDQDEYGSQAFPDRLAEGVSGQARKCLFEQCGHVPHREQPDRLLKEMDAFLAWAGIR